MMEPVPIAIVGMSCRLPGGANSPEQLWDMLEQGRNAWTDVPKDRFRWESFYHPDSDLPNTTNHRGGHFLDQDVAAFDAKFFGIAGHEAEAMDPQQRMLIELSYEALENAGIPRERVRGSSTGVYMAIFNNDYGRILTHDVASLPKTFLTGNALCMLANKVSYLLDLKGPSILVDTACSGSLVAIHQACQALRTYEIETAITGAANLILDPDVMVAMSDQQCV
jgi:acyl transferase domain-containing protein